MKEKIILPGQGVLMGLSTTKIYKGKTVLFYDGDKKIMEISLNTASPTRLSGVPGIEKYLFFRHDLSMCYPEEAENDIRVFVSRN